MALEHARVVCHRAQHGIARVGMNQEGHKGIAGRRFFGRKTRDDASAVTVPMIVPSTGYIPSYTTPVTLPDNKGPLYPLKITRGLSLRFRKPLLYPTELRGGGLNLAYLWVDWKRRLRAIYLPC